MGSRSITAEEADALLEKWATQSLQVCFGVRFDCLAWHASWLGPIYGGQSGRWIQTAEQTTNVVCTDLYEEIVLLEGEELLGIRFRNPKGFAAANFEVILFIVTRGDILKESEAMLKKIFE
jgi:hypothetical protein